MNAKIWQMVQSSNTKGENLENDFNEISLKMVKKKTRFWQEEEREESSSRLPGFVGTSRDVVGLMVWSVVQGSGSFLRESIFALVTEGFRQKT